WSGRRRDDTMEREIQEVLHRANARG
ncbi:MAG: hypothetical protein RLZZ314_463, partial [Bacteroidota bacterium]